MVSQCAAGAWLNELASKDQHQLTGSVSTLEACLLRCAIQIHHYFTFTLLDDYYYLLYEFSSQIQIKQIKQHTALLALNAKFHS